MNNFLYFLYYPLCLPTNNYIYYYNQFFNYTANVHNLYLTQSQEIQTSYLSQSQEPQKKAQEKKIFIIKKRGRRGRTSKANEVNNDSSNGKNYYIHTKNKVDNILTKIQVSYINFLINLINLILESINRKDLKFLYLNAKFKQNNSKTKRKELLEKTIGEIISTEISAKYSTLEKDRNLKVYEIIKNDNSLGEIMNIFNKNFLFFFENIYYHSIRNFNLKDYGLMDLKIELPKQFELFENLLMKNKKDCKFEIYKSKMEQCAKKHFLEGLKGGLQEEEDKKDD